ncbi:ATP-binding protein [Paenibacillus koleovorans]|uniref:ATP-binding protein n=1 Tax=Paenibacillus koleovorans TaxID=121608 RepID=UPI000FD97790|nr:ATP-binding protein [Paenibacillus koleovorans]
MAMLRFAGDEAGKEVYVLELTNSLSNLTAIHEAFTDFAGRNKLEEKLSFQLKLICDEIFTNIVSYAYSDNQQHIITIRFAITEEAITVAILDDGAPFDPLTHPAPDPQLPIEERGIGGWGIQFARTMMDEVSYKRLDHENELTLFKRIK